MVDKTRTVRDHRQVFWDPGEDYCMQLQKNIHASIPRKALPMVLAGPWGEAQPRQEGAVWKSPEVWEKMERHYFIFFFLKDLKRNKSLTKPETTECKNIVDAAPAQLAAPRAWCCCVCFSDASASPHGVTMQLREGHASSQIPSVQSRVPPIAKIIIWLLVNEPCE